MNTKTLLLSLLALLALLHARSQGCPPNLDFEDGNFSNWQCFTGSTKISNAQNVISLQPSPPVTGRHEIIGATLPAKMDPYGNFPMVCPYGGKYSVKLGNANTSSEAEGLSYTFTIPSNTDTFSFTYFYAVVFEDPQHFSYEQPRFFVSAYDVATGAEVNCASFNYISNGAIPGFQRSKVKFDVLYKDWTPAALQFAGMGGKTVRLEFKTADCTRGGHFGYAYVDVISACSNLLATAPYCRETNALVLNAPYGFQSYTWYNEDYSQVVGTQQLLTLSPPPAAQGVYHVDVVPYPGYGCRDTLKAVVTSLPVPDTPVAVSDYTYCLNQQATALTATPQPGNLLLWYPSDTARIGTTQAPTPATTSSGVFTWYVSQKVLYGCESFRKKITVTVAPAPVASFNVNSLRQCQDSNFFVFTAAPANWSQRNYSWDFGDGQTQTAPTDSLVSHAFKGYGNFSVKLKVTNSGICSAERTLPVTVVPRPVAAFGYPAVVCQSPGSVSFTDQSSLPSSATVINNWWWSIGGTTYQVRNPGPYFPSTAGNLPVKLVAYTPEGCRSDTTAVEVLVHSRPSAALGYRIPLCENVTIQLSSLSAMPSGSGQEAVVKWYWDVDSTSFFSLANPVVNLAAGSHHVRLRSESTLGCESLEADSVLVVNAKPSISIVVSDSCVSRTIQFSAIDLRQTVQKWYWDFGGGLRKGASSITRTYSMEGYQPFTLVTETAEGCRDTLLRPLNIYSNKAFAGKDTIAAAGEPVQLNARGAAHTTYTWRPSTGLNSATIENPVALADKDQVYQLDAVTQEGCDSHSRILIKRYLGPELYIPSGFTPNGDGLNDVLKVFPVGIRSFDFLAVYNRYGELIFKTSDYTKGWDGSFQGKALGTGTFVVMAQAVDYRGRKLLKKGTVTLLR